MPTTLAARPLSQPARPTPPGPPRRPTRLPAAAGVTIPSVSSVPADPAPGAAVPAGPGGESYVEHLRVPLRWWAVATMFWASVLLAFLVAVPTWVALLVALSLGALNAAVFASYGSASVSVLDGRFRAGRAEIPVSLLREPLPLDSGRTRRAAGVDADARAYLLLRPYVPRAVQVTLTDPDDPAPYWLVSTRHPETLAQVLASAVARARR